VKTAEKSAVNKVRKKVIVSEKSDNLTIFKQYSGDCCEFSEVKCLPVL
jgi:hypothetical protein